MIKFANLFSVSVQTNIRIRKSKYDKFFFLICLVNEVFLFFLMTY